MEDSIQRDTRRVLLGVIILELGLIAILLIVCIRKKNPKKSVPLENTEYRPGPLSLTTLAVPDTNHPLQLENVPEASHDLEPLEITTLGPTGQMSDSDSDLLLGDRVYRFSDSGQSDLHCGPATYQPYKTLSWSEFRTGQKSQLRDQSEKPSNSDKTASRTSLPRDFML